jgi:type I restriction enzyme R subunit
LNEAETRAEHIDPALAAAGWGVVAGSRVRREYPITLGRIEGNGRRGKALTADYVLEYRNTKLAVIEAKAWDKLLTEGVGQAKDYAGKLAIRFAYASNGQGIYAIDMQSGGEGEVAAYPGPDDLWRRTFAAPNAWRDRFAAVPFEDRGGFFQSRYYQDIAIERVLDAIVDGRERILLTLATGTGKTFIAFQIAWKLFHSKWNLGDWKRDGEPARRPRILFLADRNILADQAFNAFSAFPEDALVRIEPADIRKKGRVPKNGSVFFTIFQTFMSGPPAVAAGSDAVRPEPVEGRTSSVHPSTGSGRPDQSGYAESSERANTDAVRPELVEGRGSSVHPSTGSGRTDAAGRAERNFYFGEYPPDFFDFIVIDECHRGGANDESNWRGILDYFAPAVQLGLTATPKRRDNVDTYRYFGEPVFVYSLKDGINDGYLTPFRVRQIVTTLDDYVYTSDDTVVEGEVEAGRRYEEKDFNRIIEIREREKKRVDIFMAQIDQREKALVFCANQAHALAIRDLISQVKTSADPFYCVRVTANDGALGEQYLRDFQDNEKTLPTILTTSQKLSTGVDARNVRNIVLLRPIHSMIEFKQIIGRGTRLFDGKAYFTIYDFVKAHHHFSDPEWDGEPLEPAVCEKCGSNPCVCEKAQPQPCTVCGRRPCECAREPCEKCGKRPCVCAKKAKVRLADGKARTIQHMMATSFWHPDGKPMSAQQFLEALFGRLPEFFRDEDELRALWSDPETRRKLLEGLADKGFGNDQLGEMQKIIDAENSDLFDVLAYVAYAQDPLTREQRALQAKGRLNDFDYKQRAFLDFVLGQYVQQGVGELDQDKLSPLLRLKYHAIADAAAELGPPEHIREMFVGFQKYLYEARTDS